MKTLRLVIGSALGKVLGLAREVTLAFFLGASGAADAFRVSLTAALIPTHFFMGDVLDGAFVPLYSRYLTSNPASARRLFRVTATYLGLVSLIVAALTWVAGRQMVRLFAPGISNETAELASRMVRWMGLGIPVYCFAALYSLYGICHGRFWPIALRSAFQNGVLVLVIPVAAWLHNPEWLGIGFPIAFVLYLAYTVWTLSDVEAPTVAAGASRAEGGNELRVLFRTATPLIFTLILGQLLGVIDRAAASFVGTGAVASLDYARAFVETPQVLVGYAVGTVALAGFTSLDRHAVPARAAELIFPLVTGSLGGMLVLMATATDVVTIAYHRGRFDATAVELVSQAVRGLAVGAAFMMAVYVMMRIISAQLRNRENILPMAAAVLVEVGACVLLVPRLGLFGVGLSVSLMQMVLCALLAWRLRLAGQFVERFPGWLLGVGAVRLLVWALPAEFHSPVLHLTLTAIAVLAAWILANAATASTRQDLLGLVRRLRQAMAHLRPQPAS